MLHVEENLPTSGRRRTHKSFCPSPPHNIHGSMESSCLSLQHCSDPLSTRAPTPGYSTPPGLPSGIPVWGTPWHFRGGSSSPLQWAETVQIYHLQISWSFSRLLPQGRSHSTLMVPSALCTCPSAQAALQDPSQPKELKIPKPCISCPSTDASTLQGFLTKASRLLGGHNSAKILVRVCCPSNLPLFQEGEEH